MCFLNGGSVPAACLVVAGSRGTTTAITNARISDKKLRATQCAYREYESIGSMGMERDANPG